MIKPNELRIGNLIFCKSQLEVVVVAWPHPAQIVVNYKNKCFEADCVHGDLEGYDAIPLSSEWLKCMGFTWHEEEKVYSIQVGNTLYIEFDKEFDCTITPETWRGSSVTTWADIKYVHQLQNLYHSLTGKELEIKI